MSLTKEQRIGHLRRRLGLGASYDEVEFYSKLGVDGTIERLINYEKVPEGFDIGVALGRKTAVERRTGSRWLARDRGRARTQGPTGVFS